MRARTAVLSSKVLAVAFVASAAWADSPFNAKGSIRDNLQILLNAKKSVIVVLKNGSTYTAKVGGIGEHHVVLTEPHGKEYYDVLVAIEEIAALEVRARDE